MEQKNTFTTFFKKYSRWLILIAVIILLEWLKQKPFLIENLYSSRFYPFIGNTIRILLGWVPFSVGDLLISSLVLLLLVKLITRLARLFRRKTLDKTKWLSGLMNGVFNVALIYTIFLVFWGLHYYRLGTAHQLQLQPVEYTNNDLDTLLTVLHKKLYIICADSALIEKQKTQERSLLARDAYDAYQKTTSEYAFIKFRHTSLKPMLFGPFQSYTGYTGYLNPFTGEAHVNFYVPPLDLPFTLCHEMAHQVGYGHESEANMVGFLACRSSENVFFQYSAYSNMQGYAQAEMYNRDTILYQQYRKNIPAILLKDRIENTKFNEKHQNFFQPIINWVYGQYLESNNQPLGLKSYNYVVAWLVAYGKKFGWDNI